MRHRELFIELCKHNLFFCHFLPRRFGRDVNTTDALVGVCNLPKRVTKRQPKHIIPTLRPGSSTPMFRRRPWLSFCTPVVNCICSCTILLGIIVWVLLFAVIISSSLFVVNCVYRYTSFIRRPGVWPPTPGVRIAIAGRVLKRLSYILIYLLFWFVTLYFTDRLYRCWGKHAGKGGDDFSSAIGEDGDEWCCFSFFIKSNYLICFYNPLKG